MVILCYSVLETVTVITFRVSRRRHKMYCGHARLCVCLCACPQPHAYTIARTRMYVGGELGVAP